VTIFRDSVTFVGVVGDDQAGVECRHGYDIRRIEETRPKFIDSVARRVEAKGGKVLGSLACISK